MIDLHSHVLFDIDDGAEDIDDSIEILIEAEAIGINKMIATPHFTTGEDVEIFSQKRKSRLEKLKEAAAKRGINVEIKPGAEVYITDELFNETSLGRLTLGEGNYILSEFKYHMTNAGKFLEYIDYILDEGFIPLVAHVERYSFVRNNPMLIKSLVMRSVPMQVNAISLFEDSESGDFARMLIHDKLVKVLASDIHNLYSKRFKAMEKLGNYDDGYIQDLLNKNPEIIFDNKKDLL